MWNLAELRKKAIETGSHTLRVRFVRMNITFRTSAAARVNLDFSDAVKLTVRARS
jgi:hypothetical protein